MPDTPATQPSNPAVPTPETPVITPNPQGATPSAPSPEPTASAMPDTPPPKPPKPAGSRLPLLLTMLLLVAATGVGAYYAGTQGLLNEIFTPNMSQEGPVVVDPAPTATPSPTPGPQTTAFSGAGYTFELPEGVTSIDTVNSNRFAFQVAGADDVSIAFVQEMEILCVDIPEETEVLIDGATVTRRTFAGLTEPTLNCPEVDPDRRGVWYMFPARDGETLGYTLAFNYQAQDEALVQTIENQIVQTIAIGPVDAENVEIVDSSGLLVELAATEHLFNTGQAGNGITVSNMIVNPFATDVYQVSWEPTNEDGTPAQTDATTFFIGLVDGAWYVPTGSSDPQRCAWIDRAIDEGELDAADDATLAFLGYTDHCQAQ